MGEGSQQRFSFCSIRPWAFFEGHWFSCRCQFVWDLLFVERETLLRQKCQCTLECPNYTFVLAVKPRRTAGWTGYWPLFVEAQPWILWEPAPLWCMDVCIAPSHTDPWDMDKSLHLTLSSPWAPLIKPALFGRGKSSPLIKKTELCLRGKWPGVCVSLPSGGILLPDPPEDVGAFILP